MAEPRTDAGRRVRELRESNGLSTRELDGLAGLTPGHVSQIENTLGDRVSARTMLSIARVFGVSSAWILDGEGESPTKKKMSAAIRRAKSRKVSPGEPDAA